MKIKDVIHGEIEIFDPQIISLIHTKEFQRLRKIKQLGLTNLIFPSAEHTRYAHSVGVYRILEMILAKFEVKEQIFFSSFEKKCLLIAGLLHDLGHGPLSHAAENFFNYSHEDYTIKIIKYQEGGIYQILAKEPELIDGVTALIAKKHKNKALNSLLSSSLDADRMDYLVRDSYYTGAVYGKIDLERIIDGFEYHDKKIVIAEKMIHTMEDFILSRYHMFVQVYLNPKSIYYELLIKKILERVFLLYSQDFQFKSDISILLDLTETEINIGDYLLINDYNFLSLINQLQHEDDYVLNKLVNFFEFQNLFDQEREVVEKNNQKQDLREIMELKIESSSKQVYNTKEPIYVIKTGTNEVLPIEEISPIFGFAIEKLKITREDSTLEIRL